MQGQEESLEDWADRVLTLATPAFADLSEDHMRYKAIARFCQGCNDKEAAIACLFGKSLEHGRSPRPGETAPIHIAGKKNRRGREDISVNAVQSSSEAKTEELIASALKEFAKQMHITPHTAVVKET